MSRSWMDQRSYNLVGGQSTSVAAVEMRAFTTCGGVPTWIVNDEHGLLLPSIKSSSKALDFKYCDKGHTNLVTPV